MVYKRKHVNGIETLVCGMVTIDNGSWYYSLVQYAGFMWVYDCCISVLATTTSFVRSFVPSFLSCSVSISFSCSL